ncbi:MAG: LysE family transporter [Bacteroidales bacterium]|nr:LysE family transporter [Bacteroidales bacterium]
MPISLLPSLLLAIIVVGYTPGPANLYSLACCLKYGRRKALKMWRGLFIGFCIDLFLMVLLTHLLGEMMGHYVVYLKYIGVAYILWLAWKMFRDQGLEDTEAKDCTFTSGMLMQMTNAKMLLFELTVFSTYVLPYSNRLISLFLVAPLLLIAGPGANFAWLYAGAYLRRFLHKYRKQVDLTMALLLAACAIYILFL